MKASRVKAFAVMAAGAIALVGSFGGTATASSEVKTYNVVLA